MAFLGNKLARDTGGESRRIVTRTLNHAAIDVTLLVIKPIELAFYGYTDPSDSSDQWFVSALQVSEK